MTQPTHRPPTSISWCSRGRSRSARCSSAVPVAGSRCSTTASPGPPRPTRPTPGPRSPFRRTSPAGGWRRSLRASRRGRCSAPRHGIRDGRRLPCGDCSPRGCTTSHPQRWPTPKVNTRRLATCDHRSPTPRGRSSPASESGETPGRRGQIAECRGPRSAMWRRAGSRSRGPSRSRSVAFSLPIILPSIRSPPTPGRPA